MAAPETTVSSVLSSAGSVTALVGAVPEQRIYPDAAPLGTALPAIVYERISTEPQYALDGELLISRATMLVTCWAATRYAAEALGDVVLDTMRAANALTTARSGDLDPEVYAAGGGSFGTALQIEIWF